MAILAVTALVSYERAKAESLGLSAKGGLMERGERMFLLGVAFLSSVIFVPVLWILLVLVSFTAISRFVKVWNAASGRDAVIRRRIEAWREGRVDSRWRAWREARESTRRAPTGPRPHDRCPGGPLAGAPPGGAEQSIGPHPPGAPPRHPGPAPAARGRAGPPAARRPRPDQRPERDRRDPCPGRRRALTKYLTYRGLGAAMGHMPEPLADGIARGVARVMAERGGAALEMNERHMRRVLASECVDGVEPDPTLVRRWSKRTFDSYARYWATVLGCPTRARRACAPAGSCSRATSTCGPPWAAAAAS